MQSRASSPSPMFSRITILLFWYVVSLSENQTSVPAPGKKYDVLIFMWYKCKANSKVYTTLMSGQAPKKSVEY